jgi:hypothetical protein
VNSSELSPADNDQLRAWISSEGGIITEDADLVLTLEEIQGKISVLPHWVDDTVKLKRQIPIDYYKYPDPPVLTGDFSKCRGIIDAELQVDLTTRVFFIKDNTELAHDLVNLGASVSETYTNDVTDVVVDYRKGSVYRRAERDGKAVGSSDWIRKIIQEKVWSDPKVNLIYYPIPQYHIPDMENAIVTVSGYTGQTRLNIAKMVVAVGATFTRYLTESHTHLICAFDNGEKYEKAAGWNIHIVNLTWIEEVFKKWEHQREASPRFVAFNTGYLDMNTRIEELDQWLVDDSGAQDSMSVEKEVQKVSDRDVLLEKRAQNIPEVESTSKRIKLDHNFDYIITFTGCRPSTEEENVQFHSLTR